MTQEPAPDATVAVTYGSTVDTAGEGRVGFSEEHLRFLPASKLTWKERSKKIILLAVPLLVAGAVVCGAAWFFARDVFGRNNNTHPSSSSSLHATTPMTTPGSVPTRSDTPSTKLTKQEEEEEEDLRAECLAHAGCKALAGMCCPTDEGVYLECCYD